MLTGVAILKCSAKFHGVKVHGLLGPFLPNLWGTVLGDHSRLHLA